MEVRAAGIVQVGGESSVDHRSPVIVPMSVAQLEAAGLDIEDDQHGPSFAHDDERLVGGRRAERIEAESAD